MGALKKAVVAVSKPKTLAANAGKKGKSKGASPKVLLARKQRAALERERNKVMLKKFEDGVPVSTLSSRYKISSSAVYQRISRARTSKIQPKASVALVTPALINNHQVVTSEIAEMTQVAFLRGRIQQLEMMLKQVLAILGTRKLTAG